MRVRGPSAHRLVVQVADFQRERFASARVVRFVVEKVRGNGRSLCAGGYRIRDVGAVHHRAEDRPFARGFDADIAPTDPL